MKPVPEFHRVTDDLFVWHGYNPECKTDCTSTALRTPEGFVLVDPVRLEEQALARMVGDHRIAAVVLTSGNHQRGSLYEKERLDIPIYAPQGAIGEVPADFWYKDGDMILGALEVLALPGGALGESALLGQDVAIVGDALVNLSELMLLPDKYCSDPAQLRESVARLAEREFDILCMAHGLPIIAGARAKVRDLISRQPAGTARG